jgi:hypothetical protein
VTFFGGVLVRAEGLFVKLGLPLELHADRVFVFVDDMVAFDFPFITMAILLLV